MSDAPGPRTRSYRAHAESVRDSVLPIRLNGQEKAQIRALAEARGVSMARLMKEATLSASYDRRDRVVLVEALDQANRMLANIAGNINQLAYHANMAQALVAQAELDTALGQVRDVREELAEVLRRVK